MGDKLDDLTCANCELAMYGGTETLAEAKDGTRYYTKEYKKEREAGYCCTAGRVSEKWRVAYYVLFSIQVLKYELNSTYARLCLVVGNEIG